MSSIEIEEKKPLFMPVFLCEFSNVIFRKFDTSTKSLLQNIICVAGNAKICPSGVTGFEITNIDHKNLYDINIGNGYWAVNLVGLRRHYNFNVNLFDLYGQSHNFDDFVLIRYEDYKTIKEYCRKFAIKSQDGKIKLYFNEYSYSLD